MSIETKEKKALDLQKGGASDADKNAGKLDPSALFCLGYGLYVVTAREGERDNGLIVNTAMQVTNTPDRVAVTINKTSLTHDMIQRTGMMNVNCLSVKTPYSVFELFGMKSGRTVNKFEDIRPERSANGLAVLPQFINAVLSLRVERCVDLDSHTMFICTLTESEVRSKEETMTYAYYHAKVKPRPATAERKGYVCRICGYVYEGESLPEDFICPVCLHGASDFEPL